MRLVAPFEAYGTVGAPSTLRERGDVRTKQAPVAIAALLAGAGAAWLAANRSIKTDIHDRLQETQFCLEASYKLYLTYRIDKVFITIEDALEQYTAYYQQLRAIVKEQNNRVNRSRGIKTDVDYLKDVLECVM